MSSLKNRLGNLLAIMPAYLLFHLANAFIAMFIGGVIGLHLFVDLGWGRNLSLLISIVVALILHLYLNMIPKIKEYINRLTLNS